MEYRCMRIFDSAAKSAVNGLRLAEVMNTLDGDGPPSQDEPVPVYNLQELSISNVLTCSYCSVTFADAAEQRHHYKLDWHRYNLKRGLSGKDGVSEEAFLSLQDDISSISGSDTETSDKSDTEASEPDKVPSEPVHNNRHSLRTIRHTKVFFENEDNRILSVYRCLLHTRKESPNAQELVSSASDLVKETKKWLVVMLGGGHFAAAIFQGDEVLHHKTFHSYTVRAKQGGSQSTRDNRGGSHPKSAGASLRRYNEQAQVQHVQEIMCAWTEPLKQCSLILYRATGPANRSVLFGGKNPPLNKTDKRLRNIPFPTKRATFKEVKRVYEILSSVEIYGSADDFKCKFPKSPDKKARAEESPSSSSSSPVKAADSGRKSEKAKSPGRVKEKVVSSPGRQELTKDDADADDDDDDEDSEGSSDEGDDLDVDLTWGDATVDFSHLKEFEDTVPESVKDQKRVERELGRKKKKFSSKQKAKFRKKLWEAEFARIHRNLTDSCTNGNRDVFTNTMNTLNRLPRRPAKPADAGKNPSYTFTKEDFVDCLNTPLDEESKNTLLHLAAVECRPEFVCLLLKAGADPSVRNASKMTPCEMAGNKETRNSFKGIDADKADKADSKKGPDVSRVAVADEDQDDDNDDDDDAADGGADAKDADERKREKRKQKRQRQKMKKQEMKKEQQEAEEKNKFLALSDREKRALAAERRLVSSLTANLKSAKPPVLSRCFQCGVDITGKVPFEYSTNRFCSVACVKAHRSKTGSYGVEI